jgi:hypothetical protein
MSSCTRTVPPTQAVTLKQAKRPRLAFVTSFDESAPRGLGSECFEYLLKPVDKTRLRAALNWTKDCIEYAESAAQRGARVDRLLRPAEAPVVFPCCPACGPSRSLQGPDHPTVIEGSPRRRRRGTLIGNNSWQIRGLVL